MKIKELRPIKIDQSDFDMIEEKIKALFKKQIYIPLLKVLNVPPKTLKNSKKDLISAIQSGRISFYRGNFYGRFNASISKELKNLGARWDKKQGSWKILQSSLPMEIKHVISDSKRRFQEKIAEFDETLARLRPEKIAEDLDVAKQFDTTLLKTEKEFLSSVKGIIVPADLSDIQRKKISEEWQNNMRLWIKQFTENQIIDLRKDVQTGVFTSERHESIAKRIQKSFEISQNKAKFLARQETSLLMAKFKETRYISSGINEYRWTCVSGSPNHPVRPMHKALDGTVHTWNNPPIVDKQGSRKNPGEDYNCRCFARPLVRF